MGKKSVNRKDISVRETTYRRLTQLASLRDMPTSVFADSLINESLDILESK